VTVLAGPAPAADRRAAVAPALLEAHRPMLGGVVSVHASADAAPRALERVLDRIAAWAARLTRFDAASDLMRLNAAPGNRVRIGPTLTAVLDWARAAEGLTDGLVDVAMLEARLAAEAGEDARPPLAATRRWSLDRGPRASTVRREPGVRFDLDGVGKGWLADRALAIMPGRSAMVDADGDICLRVEPGDAWAVGIADPRPGGGLLGVLQFRGEDVPRRLGVATSGTSVHRWARPDGDAHHLIDPRTWRPAATDIAQATVVAASAREAEAFAKTAVIAGADRAFSLLDRPGVLGAVVLTAHGGLEATPETMRWLA
jgi:thiamine biosynthesis lipoprotein